ncbi:PAS domain-containing protein [Colwellia sp. MB02u-10]|uniref:ATP-binding protein n=1 Tax=Colwellia sp. MB02u-10 TaxID=2759828 RepID=UPI0015F3DB2C|nr:ATP-binding protein [Colwellia sp. MB02u-10]MBA6339575.1 PAS domain-containing protein [Colwellia sp. MB02u-10]
MFKLSFKTKTIMGIALIETFFLLILVLESRSILYETIEFDLKERAHNISTLLATASVDAVVSEDIATLESIVDSAMITSNILYIKIRGLDRVLAERGEQAFLERKFKADNSIAESEIDQSFDVFSEIFVEGYRFGRVEVGLSLAEQKAIIKAATQSLTTIALIELMFVGLFSLLLGITLTKRLILLQEAAVKMSQGETGLQIPLAGNDELTDASRAFNLMSTKISAVTQTLKSDNARMDAIMNTATDAIFMISLDGVVHSMNRATHVLFGYQEQDIIGQSMFDFIPELHLCDIELSTARHVQCVNGVTSKGKKIPLEIHSSGMEFNNQHYIVGVIRDLTIINQLKDELEAVFNLSPNGFLILAKDLSISYVNPAFYSMFSLVTDCLNDHDWECFKGVIAKSMDYDQHKDMKLLDELYTENILYLKLPVEKILRVSRQKIDKTDVDSSDILFFVDITHETIVDKIKSEFLTSAAHELRTPLASVMGFSELLTICNYGPEKTKEMAGSINKQSKRLKQIVDDLIDVASIENKTPGMLDMVQDTLKITLTELCDEFSGSDNFHTIDLQQPKYWPLVAFDSSKIRQIISNILNNSYRYSPNSSVVKVYTTMKVTEETSEFGVIIEDSGIGMTAEQLSHVGERFYRADTSGNIPGTGLGISLVKDLINMHNGRFEITSTIGQGTIVTLWLPNIIMDHVKLDKIL